jgi:hypothetical protein
VGEDLQGEIDQLTGFFRGHGTHRDHIAVADGVSGESQRLVRTDLPGGHRFNGHDRFLGVLARVMIAATL